MHDLVCVKIHDSEVGIAFALTWGRVFDSVDEKDLNEALICGLFSFGLRKIRKLEVCESLQEGSKQPYFFEGLFSFAQKPIPFGKKSYVSWAHKTRTAIASGREIFVISDIRPLKRKRR